MSDASEPRDLLTFTDLNDVEDLGSDPGMSIEAPGLAFCSCGRRMRARVGMLREPVFPPEFGVRIVPVGEPAGWLGFRDSWYVGYVCNACRHYYGDFANRLMQQEAEEVVLRSRRETGD